MSPRERHWYGWREQLPPVAGRPAVAEQTLWHERAGLPTIARMRTRCGEDIPRDRTLMRYAGARPPGTICAECWRVIVTEEAAGAAGSAV